MNDERKGPGEAAGDGKALHGSRTDVNWDQGRGREPYANQEQPQGPAAAHEAEGGDRGEQATTHIEQARRARDTPGLDRR